jgi:hypothetical protein
VENPVDRTLKNWIPAGAGFLAAAIMVAWLNPFPPQAKTLQQVLFIYAMSLAFSLLILGASAGASFAAWLVIRIIDRKKPRPPRMVWRTASRAVWLLPLYLFTMARSAWAVVVTVLLMLGLVHVLRNLQPASRQKTALSSGWKIFACILAGAGIEAGLIAAGIQRTSEAVLIVTLATLIVAWLATRGGRSGHPSRGLVTIFLAIVFSSGALVRRVGVQPGEGFLGFPVDLALEASVIALQKSFGGGPIVPLAPNRVEAAEGSAANVNVAGVPHRGIFLWPDVKKDETTLVPPLPLLGRKVFGKDRKTTLTIPFYGAYWFFRPPYLHPPFDSLVMHGSPAVHSFLSNDGSPLWEEAHQDLQTNLDLSGCSRIEMDIKNADKHPDRMEIELLIVNIGGRPRRDIQSLGRKQPVSRPEQVAVEETLPYPLAAEVKAKSISEIIVRFHLLLPRQLESAQVEIERFRLVPKGKR